MGVNKIIVGGNTVIDLTKTTATADEIVEGYTIYDQNGNVVTGTAAKASELSVTLHKGFYNYVDVRFILKEIDDSEKKLYRFREGDSLVVIIYSDIEEPLIEKTITEQDIQGSIPIVINSDDLKDLPTGTYYWRAIFKSADGETVHTIIGGDVSVACFIKDSSTVLYELAITE